MIEVLIGRECVVLAAREIPQDASEFGLERIHMGDAAGCGHRDLFFEQ